MVPTGPVGHEQLARMPYQEACLKVAALARPHSSPRSHAAVVACQTLCGCVTVLSLCA